MKRFILVLILALHANGEPTPSSPPPVDAMQHFTLDVKFWRGSFGTYMLPAAGSKIQLDLSAVGSDGLLTVSPGDEKSPRLGWPLDKLALVSDETEGSPTHGWRRRVVLKGTYIPNSTDRTILELIIGYEVERYEEQEGRRVKQTGNVTHYTLTLHTLAADDTVREYGTAFHSESRN